MIRHADFNAASYVACNMREKDYAEIFSTRDNDETPFDIANEVMFAGFSAGVAFVAYDENEQPVCVFGAHQKWQGVWDVFMFATDDFDSVASEVTKFIKKSLIKMILMAGAHRAECKSLSTHDDAHKWLKFFGAKKESTLKGYGRNGEDFYCFRWLKDEVAENV